MANDGVDWGNAPEWARFASMDASGAQHWYEEKPFYESHDNVWLCMHGRYASFLNCDDWKDSLTQRPQE